jgi:hypothetical protein
VEIDVTYNAFRHWMTPDGRLRPEKVEDLIYEVSSGKHVFQSAEPPFALYASRTPTIREAEAARLVYIKKFHEALQAGLMTKEDLERVAIQSGVFSQKDRKEKVALTSQLDDLARAREMTRDAQQKLEFDAQILNLQKRLGVILDVEQEVFRHSAEADAETWRQLYFVSQCTMGGETLEERVWATWDELLDAPHDPLVKDARMGFHRVQAGLPITLIRALARCGHWRQVWKGAREAGSPLFEGPSVSWDTNKKNLVWWSDFYESIFQHQERPPEETINNDEALQTWMNQMVARAQEAKARAGAHSGRGPNYKDGRGRSIGSVQVGSENRKVGQSFKIRR